MRPIITLTSDFGVSSPYVAQMKGEILKRNREALLVDITHAIAPQNIVQGAVVLEDVSRRFPAATIHVAVVDPGVGTSRRLVYAEIDSQRYLVPDNGLLTLVARRQPPTTVIELSQRRYWSADVSSTFHGRDVLAPVAAHLSLGIKPELLGPSGGNLLLLDIPEPQFSDDHVVGRVLLADSFGNLITNLRREKIEMLGALDHLSVTCKEWTVYGISRTYGDHKPGTPLALFDSQDRLEIAVANGSAAIALGAESGTCVIVRRS
jgi:S-adenosylmethionine hydrolase